MNNFPIYFLVFYLLVKETLLMVLSYKLLHERFLKTFFKNSAENVHRINKKLLGMKGGNGRR